jgi:hypothetical protein
MTPALQAAIDAAVKAEAERIFDQVRAGIGECSAFRMLCEARDPFFPREQEEES